MVLASASFVVSVFSDACSYAASAIRKIAVGRVDMLAAAEKQPTSLPRVALRRAGQFVLRLLKRERPEVTPDWRLVPST